ncbi:hypothetical protein FOA52_011568 [Chlamydomonas sp. UWO 241]|nr:hypothetical protein FOA52_011568 [Chlamydomonas sp. UWO 241]
MKTLHDAVDEESKRKGIPASQLTHLELDGRCRTTNCASLTAFGLKDLVCLSLCSTGVSSLASFPSLPSLRTLRVSDCKVSGGLEHLVSAGLTALTKLDLSGNAGLCRIEQLAPLKQLHVKSLDLDGCPVKDTPGFATKLFTMLDELEYLDNVDRHGVEREGDDDDEEEEEFEGEEGAGGDAAGEDDEGEEGEDEAAPAPDYAALLKDQPLEDDEEEYEEEGEDDDDEDFDEGEDEDEEEEAGSAKKRKRAADDTAGPADEEEESEGDDEEEA